ncbi:MAG: hypothetical protein Q4B72_11290 [Lachnospiraceae bacterium]|nr:hypothetical protein [Lachnospiraceae bacterium]
MMLRTNIAEGLDILSKQRSEVYDMLLTEFDEERYERTLRQDAYEDGFRDGFIESFRETHKDCYDEALEEALLRIAYEPYDKLFEILSKEKEQKTFAF